MGKRPERYKRRKNDMLDVQRRNGGREGEGVKKTGQIDTEVKKTQK